LDVVLPVQLFLVAELSILPITPELRARHTELLENKDVKR
jgi:hypothetical protein